MKLTMISIRLEALGIIFKVLGEVSIKQVRGGRNEILQITPMLENVKESDRSVETRCCFGFRKKKTSVTNAEKK